MKKIFLAVLSLFYIHCLVFAGVIYADWPMVAANPQRTSWVADQVIANSVEVYRGIEPYIPQHVQLIAANNLIYVSTARGLYALDANNLNTVWRFDTEVPLGNSPTIAAVNGVSTAFVGGFDRNLYALNASTGALIWTFSGAKAGYDTNPLVINDSYTNNSPLVLLGNRDGNFYAVNAINGSKVWSFQTEGPINFSAAYKNGIIYFASMDARAYALNVTNGSLVWKSSIMGGDGFYSYWPVIFTNPDDNKDYIIFVNSSGYRPYIGTRPGVGSMPTCSSGQYCEYPEWVDEWRNNFSGYLASSAPSQSWAQGKPVVDYTSLTQYFEENPNGQNPDQYWHKSYRRFYYIYNATAGPNQTAVEWSMDTDGDGFREYAPIDPILSNSGNPYPPVVIGNQTAANRLLYFGNHYESNGQSQLTGWRMGTKYMNLLGTINAGDEPNALSAGGNLIYRSICCARPASWYDTTPAGGTGIIYGYGSLPSAVYNGLWWYPTSWSDMEGLFGDYANIGLGVNGIYNSHGDQNPIVPYNGKLYIHRNNFVLKLGTTSSQTQVATLISDSVKQTLIPPPVNELLSRLEDEVSKIVAAGHLRPGYYNAGQQTDHFWWLRDYFAQPGDTLLALSMAYPYITNTTANNNLKDRLKAYLKNEFNNFTHVGWDGAKREWVSLPPEVEADMASGGTDTSCGYKTVSVCTVRDSYYNYALWKYVQNVAPEDRAAALAKTTTTTDGRWPAPYASNRSIAGTVGLTGLNNQSTTVNSCSQFQANSPYTSTANYIERATNISRNFMFMVKELADCYAKNSAVISALANYEKVGPYWFVSRYTSGNGETTTTNLYDYPSLFAAKAWVQNLPYEELTKWLDVPAFKIGDLFYIQNLAIAISKYSGPLPTPSSTPTPTPVATQRYGILDLRAAIAGFTNIFNINNIIANYGPMLSSPTTTPTPIAGGPPGNPADWILTFSDEFNGTSLDTTKWATTYGYNTGRGFRTNNYDELEWYVSDDNIPVNAPTNAHNVSGGTLKLTAKRECLDPTRPDVTDVALSDPLHPYSCSSFPYWSGMIASFKSFSQKYGYFEAKVKIPKGDGSWPAFWLLPMPDPLPTSVPWPDNYVFWPPEIDIFENFGNNVNNLSLNSHYSGTYPIPGYIGNDWSYGGAEMGNAYNVNVDYSAAFHTVGLDWQPDHLTWYVDGVQKYTTNTHLPPGTTITHFPGSMYMILNLAINGSPSFNQLVYEIDYVRVWQKIGQAPTTTPTSTSNPN